MLTRNCGALVKLCSKKQNSAYVTKPTQTYNLDLDNNVLLKNKTNNKMRVWIYVLEAKPLGNVLHVHVGS